MKKVENNQEGMGSKSGSVLPMPFFPAHLAMVNNFSSVMPSQVLVFKYRQTLVTCGGFIPRTLMDTVFSGVCYRSKLPKK